MVSYGCQGVAGVRSPSAKAGSWSSEVAAQWAPEAGGSSSRAVGQQAGISTGAAGTWMLGSWLTRVAVGWGVAVFVAVGFFLTLA